MINLSTSDLCQFIVSRIPMVSSGITTSRETISRHLLAASEMTTSGITFLPTRSLETTRQNLNQLRKLSGLTWEQLAKLFNVSRRSLHFWASGEPLSRFNEENLNRLLGTIRYIDRGSASLNRDLLLRPSSDGRSVFDLLVAGEHDEAKKILGFGHTPEKPKLGELSEDELRSRLPPNPADLIDALPDTIHREVGRSRPARTTKSNEQEL